MQLKAVTLALYALSIIVGIAAWQLPIVSKQLDQNDNANIHTALGISIAYTLLHILAVWLFYSGLRNFKEELRKPYRTLCIGLITIALAQLQGPLAVFANALWWINDGFVVILYVVPNLFIYSGIRLFARLLRISSKLMLFRYILPLSMLPVALSYALPVRLSSVATSAPAAHAFLALPLWQLTVTGICAYLVWRIQRTMGSSYTNAMKWLFRSMLVYMGISMHFVLLSYIGYDSTWYGRSGIYLIVFIALGTMFVTAGYQFWKIGVSTGTGQEASPLEVVLYAANLATNPGDIDAILDEVRGITAQLAPGQPLNPEQERRLGAVYLQIEKYLVTQEPLRKLTQPEIRQRIRLQFHQNSQNGPFWQSIA